MDLMARSSFRSQGYVVLQNVVGPRECASLLDKCTHLPTLKAISASEERAERVHQHISLREVLARTPLLTSALKDLLGPSLQLLLNRHNHFGISRGNDYRSARMHRDALGWMRSYTTVLLPLSGFNSSGAQLRVIPGSHLWPTEGPANGGGYWLDEGPFAQMESQCLSTRLKVGDALCIDPLLFHAAGHGLPREPRGMLSLGMHGGDELSPFPAPTEVALVGRQTGYEGQSWFVEA